MKGSKWKAQLFHCS